MPVSDRDYVRGEHPPTCTCKECTDRRLARLTGRSSDKGRGKTPRRTKPISVHSNIPPFFSQTIRGTPLHRIWRKIPLSVHKLFLSLLVITGLVDIIRRGYTLFTHQTDPIKNTIIFLVEVGLWFWIVTILRSRRYKYRNPKFKLVFIIVIAITLVCAFAGIEPLSSYKDGALNSVSDYLEERQASKEAAEIAEAEKATKAKEEGLKITPVTPPEITKITPVEPPKVIMPEKIAPALRNPSWEELKAFLWEDKTDQLEYVFPTFVCHDFAKTLQASAKEAGWRCAYVCVQLEGYPDWFDYGIPSNTGHGLNVFETTDRGLVYIDCTSVPGFSGNTDKIVDVKVGKEYILKDIFQMLGWGEWLSMGTVVGIETTQW